MPIGDATDEARLESAVRSVVDDVLFNTITVSAVVTMLIGSGVMGDRIYLFVRLSDADEEHTIGGALSRTLAKPQEEGVTTCSRDWLRQPA
jgi:hypothetical protein